MLRSKSFLAIVAALIICGFMASPTMAKTKKHHKHHHHHHHHKVVS